MASLRLAFYFMCHYIMVTLSTVFAQIPERIPIGAIFDPLSEQEHTAFRFAEHEHNSNESQRSYKVYSNTCFNIDISDSFALATEVCSHFSRDTFAMFGELNITAGNTMTSYCDAFQMPFITYSTTEARTLHDASNSNSYVINMLPPYTNALVNRVRGKKWTRFFYIYDTDAGLIRIQEMSRQFQNKEYHVTMDIRRIDSTHNTTKLFHAINSMEPEIPRNIIFDIATREDLITVIKMATSFGLNKRNYEFIIATLGIREVDLKAFTKGGASVLGFQLVDMGNKTVIEFIKRWKGLSPGSWPGAGRNSVFKYQAALAWDSFQVFVRAIDKILRREPDKFRNIISRDMNSDEQKKMKCKNKFYPIWMHGKAILQAIREVRFEGLTGLIAFNQFGYRDEYELQVWESTHGKAFRQIGKWTTLTGYMQPSLASAINGGRPTNEHSNKTRIVTSIKVDPFLMDLVNKPVVDGIPRIGNQRFNGYCLDLTRKVCESIGFDFIVKVVNDGLYGAHNKKNNTWNGMIGELVRGEADMAVAPLTITSDREKVVDFSKPFMSLGISIMIKKPEESATNFLSFMDPLSYEIWMCIVFAYIGVSVVLFLVSRFSPYEWHVEESSNSPVAKNDFTIFNSLWFILAAFMQQGCEISPRSASGRIVGSVWWFFTFIIISSYTANLAAFLTVERMSTPIKSAEDLAKQTDIKYGTVKDGTSMSFFKSSQIPTYQRMWQFMKSQEEFNVFTKTTKEGIEMVRKSNGKYAHLLESTMNDYTNNKWPCNTMKVGSNLDSKGYGIATPLDSDIRHEVTLKVLEQIENGILHTLEERWWRGKGDCKNEQSKTTEPAQSALDFRNVAGIFLILTGGLAASLVTSVLELLYKAKTDSNRKKIPFMTSLKAKMHLTLHGTLDPRRDTMETEIAHHYKPMSTNNCIFDGNDDKGYTYSGPSQLIGVDGYPDTNAHTQV
ncbi:glutamate receptor-like [Tubulanus polymorphus]|uniref:glutamate receptor-like n=1 Tax=Tubulanus polymorphus TaxID=672921 RepID=UPI003DA392AB